MSLIVFATAVLASAVAAVGPMYTDAARTSIVRGAFSEAPANGQGIHFVWDRPFQTAPPFLEETPAATSIPEAFDSPIRSAQIISDTMDRSGRVTVLWREGSCEHLVILSGRCPAAPGEVVTSQPTSVRNGWDEGGQVLLRELIPPAQPGGDDVTQAPEPLPLTVVGIYEPRDPEERFWFDGEYFPHTTATSEGNPAAGLPNDALIVHESTLEWARQANAYWQVSATLLLNVEALEGDDLHALHAATTLAREWAAEHTVEWAGARAVTTTDMRSVATGAIREQESLDVSLVVVGLELVALVWLLLFLAVGDLVRARRAEISLARLRGLSRLQVWRFGLGEPLTLLILALPVAVISSVPLVRMLSGWLLGEDIPVTPDWQTWAAASVGTLGGLAAAALAARSTVNSTFTEHWRNPRPDADRRSWVVDAVVITVVVAGLVELMSGGLLTESSGEDMTALLVPGLIATAIALLMARALPRMTYLSYRVTDRRGGMASFLGLRQASRAPDATSMLVVLTVAFALATFALVAWSVTTRNHRDVARVHNGAPTVLEVIPPEGTRLVDLVDESDPGGQEAVAVAIFDRVNARFLAADMTRFGQVANWQPDFTATPLDDLLPLMRPDAAPRVMLTGAAIRITVDSSMVTASDLEFVADLELADQHGRVRLALEAMGPPGERSVHGELLPSSCHETCELRGITVLSDPAPDGGTYRAELVVTKIEVEGPSGWQTVEAGLTEPGGWRGEGDSFRVPVEAEATSDGMVLHFETGTEPRAVVATHPRNLPSITLGEIGPRPIGREVGGLDGGVQDVVAVEEAGVLPGATGPTALVDYRLAERAAYGTARDVEHQVWVTSPAAATVKANLEDRGVVVVAERTVEDLERRFNGEGPGLALALMLVLAASGAVLAMARAGLNLYAAGRRRSYDFAVLSAIGVPQATQRRALLIEQTIVVGAGVVAGGVAGVAAAMISLSRIPQFTTPPVTPPLSFEVEPLVVAIALAGCALAVAVVVLIATEAIRRTTAADTLRQAAP